MDTLSLEDYVKSLVEEGTRESTGFFTLSAPRVVERYHGLLQQHPELPWLRWMQLGYRLRGRRLLCRMLRDQHRLSFTGSPLLEKAVEALRNYPEVPGGEAGLLQEVLWLFLAQEPRWIEVRSRLPQGHLLLRMVGDQLERRELPDSLEEDLQLTVCPSQPWFAWLNDLRSRGQIHYQVARRVPLYPWPLDWDGGLDCRPLDLGGPRRLAVATLVSRAQSAAVPHFALPRPEAFGARWLSLQGQQTYDQGGRGTDWLVLEGKDLGPELPESYEIGGDRMRARLLFLWEGLSGPAQWTPVVCGVSLPPQPLPGWPPGVRLWAATPLELKTDYSGLQLVQGEELTGWLQHLRQRFGRLVSQLVRDFPQSAWDLAPLGDLMQ